MRRCSSLWLFFSMRSMAASRMLRMARSISLQAAVTWSRASFNLGLASSSCCVFSGMAHLLVKRQEVARRESGHSDDFSLFAIGTVTSYCLTTSYFFFSCH